MKQESKTPRSLAAFYKRLNANKAQAKKPVKSEPDWFDDNRFRLVAPEDLDKDALGIIPDDVLPFLQDVPDPVVGEIKAYANQPFLHTLMDSDLTMRGTVYINDNYWVPRLGQKPGDVVVALHGKKLYFLRFTYSEFVALMQEHGFADLADVKFRAWLWDWVAQQDEDETAEGIPKKAPQHQPLIDNVVPKSTIGYFINPADKERLNGKGANLLKVELAKHLFCDGSNVGIVFTGKENLKRYVKVMKLSGNMANDILHPYSDVYVEVLLPGDKAPVYAVLAHAKFDEIMQEMGLHSVYDDAFLEKWVQFFQDNLSAPQQAA